MSTLVSSESKNNRPNFTRSWVAEGLKMLTKDKAGVYLQSSFMYVRTSYGIKRTQSIPAYQMLFQPRLYLFKVQ